MSPRDFEFESVEDGIRFLYEDVYDAWQDSTAKADGFPYHIYERAAAMAVQQRIDKAQATLNRRTGRGQA